MTVACVAVSLLVPALLIGCSHGHEAGHVSSHHQEIAKVRVYTDGRVTLDGKQVAPTELRSAFASLKARDGVVWYYREQGAAAAHPTARLVMEAVMEAKVPISFSDTEDFSTLSTPDGQATPR
jgi:hypothetical protein